MIYDTLEHAGQYRKLSGNLAKALDYLTGTELETVEAGRVEIDGERVFALFQSYETKPENDRPEAHRKYIDIQYLIEGEELIGVAPLASMERVAEAVPERDIWFYEGETAKLPLGSGRFAILFPQDAHAPCIAAGECRCGRSCSRSPLNRRNEPKKTIRKTGADAHIASAPVLQFIRSRRPSPRRTTRRRSDRRTPARRRSACCSSSAPATSLR